MFYLTVHPFLARVQSPTCTIYGKCLLESIMAVKTGKHAGSIQIQHLYSTCDIFLWFSPYFCCYVSKNGILSIPFVGTYMLDTADFNWSLGEKTLVKEKEFVGNTLTFDEYASC